VSSKKRRAPKILEVAWGDEAMLPIGSRLCTRKAVTRISLSLTTTAPTPNGCSHQQKGDDNQYSGHF
jgi:hypothetical protein